MLPLFLVAHTVSDDGYGS